MITNRASGVSESSGMRVIAPGVYVYQQPDGWCRSNGGLIVDADSAIVVDTQFTRDLNDAYHTAVRGVTDKPVSYVVNTHHHGDHCYGNHFFPEALTVCHERCLAQQIRLGQPNPTVLKAMFPRYDFSGVVWTRADITFSQRMVFQHGQREVRLLHYGTAHSVSDIALHLPAERVVFCGDLLFNKNTPLGLETSFGNWLKALDALLELDALYYVPGHGPVSGPEGVEDLQGYIRLIWREAKKRYDRGIPSHEAALDIDVGEFRNWATPERVLANVERLYYEFRGEEATSPIDVSALMEEMARIAERH